MLLQAEDLRLTADEARAHFEAVYGADYDERVFQHCQAASLGHAALLAVLARTARLRPDAELSVSGLEAEGLARELEFLASAQLTEAQHHLLTAASLLGRGAKADLEVVLESGVRDHDLRRIAACIPLFRLAFADDGSSEFRVHKLGCSTFVRQCTRNPDSCDLVARAVRRLASLERYADAFELAAEYCGSEETAGFLQEYGAGLLDSGGARLLQRALEKVPPSILIHRPALLLLQARRLRLLGQEREAHRRLQLAVQLADSEDDDATRLEALVLLGRTEVYMGRSSHAREVLERALSNAGTKLDEERLALVSSHLATALVHIGRLPEAERYQQVAEEAANRSRSTSSAYCHLMPAYLLFEARGQWDRQVLLAPRGRAASVPIEVRLPALANSAVAMTLRGQLSRAERTLHKVERLMETCGAEVGVASCLTGHALIEAGRGDYSTAESLMSRIASSAVDDYDLYSNLLYRSWWRRASGDTEGALTDSEQAHEFFLEFEHLPLLWDARVESCASLLALGDDAVADERACGLEKELAAACAEGLLLRTRLIAAECLRRKGSVELARQQLTPSAAYLLSGNGNWHAAMYVRAFPGLLGTIASVVGSERIPIHLLRMVLPEPARAALDEAKASVDEGSWQSLCARIPTAAAATVSAAAPPHCTVRLFGRLSVETSDGPVTDTDWRKRKARLLFAMLVVRKGKDVPREQLLEYLWPDMDGDRARANFYVIWNNMKRALSPNLAKGKRSPYVSANGGVCRVDDVLVSTDLDDFERCLADARRAESEGDYDRMLAEYRRLSEIYQGDLLPGDIYDDWFGPLRERCRQEFSDAMLAAGKMLAEGGDHAGALQLLRQALTYDPWREDLYQTALRCQITSGQRSAAIDTYMMCMHKLSEDLGLDPSTETKKLYDQVLAMEEPPAEGYAV